MGAGRYGRAGGLSLLVIITAAAAIGFFVLLGVLVFQSMGGNAGSSGSSGPRLAVDQDRIDFGHVVYDKTVRAVFTIKNIGDQPLQISDRQIAIKLIEGC